ncbi:hypothetical protein APV28_4273 [Comamonas testosteroni]|nr:hypothetical protein APV28_4273 [Comamonas testosteroni]
MQAWLQCLQPHMRNGPASAPMALQQCLWAGEAAEAGPCQA